MGGNFPSPDMCSFYIRKYKKKKDTGNKDLKMLFHAVKIPLLLIKSNFTILVFSKQKKLSLGYKNCHENDNYHFSNFRMFTNLRLFDESHKYSFYLQLSCNFLIKYQI